MTDELAVTTLAVEVAPGHLESNLDQFKAKCQAIADEYRELGEISSWEDYQQAKRQRVALNATVKQVSDERVRVKKVFMEPLDSFYAAIDDAMAPIVNAQTRQKEQVAEYERRLRKAKHDRLEAYWDGTYPLLALNTGEAEEPLVPFDRVFDPDWTKRISEAGRDDAAKEEMDSIASTLAHGRDMILSIDEPQEIRADALSRMYRTLDPVEAVTWAHEEAKRKGDIAAIDKAIDEEQRCVYNIAEPGYGDHEEQPDPAMHVYVVTIECTGEAELMKVKTVMQQNGISGTIRRK